MKKYNTPSRLLSLILTLLMVGSCFVALPFTASAASDINEEFDNKVYESWTANTDGATPTIVASHSDFAGADDYGNYALSTYNNKLAVLGDPASLETYLSWDLNTAGSAPNKTEVDMGDFSLSTRYSNRVKSENNTWKINSTSEAIIVKDDENQLWSHDVLTVTAELYYDAFPTGQYSSTDERTPNDYPVSLLKWRHNANSFFSIRLNADGKLCEGTGEDQTVTDMQLPLKEWFTITMTIMPAKGVYTVALNGTVGYTGSFGKITSAPDLSEIHFFDSYFNYTVSARKLSIVGEKTTDVAWGFENSSGILAFHDKANALVSYPSFTIKTEMYFAEFPTGTYTGYNSMEYPFSLLKWRLIKPTAEGLHHYSIRVNGEGELCTSTGENSNTGVFLPKDEWFTIQMTVSPATGKYDIWINGELKLVNSFGASTVTTQSDVCIFDNAFKYTAYIKDPSVTTNPRDIVGVLREDSADYFGYQTKPVQNGTFDIRFLSAIDPASFSSVGSTVSDAFSEAGYEITAFWKDKSGNVDSRSQTVSMDTVYRSISANNETVTLPDGDYIHAFAIRGVDATLPRLEFSVRPYTIDMDGARRYGAATLLVWTGELDAAGCPIFRKPEQVASYNNPASEDATVRMYNVAGQQHTAPDGNATSIYVKYAGPKNNVNRNGYFKFSFTDAGISRVEDACRVLLQLPVQSAPAENQWTAEEIAAGGILGRISGCDSDWNEDTLCGVNNYPNNMPTVYSQYAWNVVYKSNDVITVDVTDYVKAMAKNGTVSFQFENTSASSRGGMTYLYSSESTSTAGNPNLVIYPTLSNYEVVLEKIGNVGYEPWSVAEDLVSSWVNGEYDKLYSSGDLSWHLDPDTMTSITDNGGNSDYTLDVNLTSRAALETYDGHKVATLGVGGKSAYYKLTDTNAKLLESDSFSVSVSLCFSALPSGAKDSSDASTANEKPMNLIRWMPTTGSYDIGIRISADGELCTGINVPSSQSGTGKYLKVGEWYTIRVDYDLTAKSYTVYLNGSPVATRTYTVTPKQSAIQLFDGAFSFTAHVKDLRVYTHEGFSTYNIDPVNNATATGAYDTPIQWRSSSMKNAVNSKVYVRSIESLAKKEGYNSAAAVSPAYNRYGGITNAGFKGQATGYFHTEVIGGRTFIIDPTGCPFFAVGMNTVEIGATDNQDAATLKKYGSEENFYASISEELRSLGINTIWGGDWQQMIDTESMSTVIHLSLISGYMSSIKLTLNNSAQKFKYNNAMNVFDPDFEAFSINKTITTAGEYVSRPEILGWVSDNEITASANMLMDYLTIDPADPANAFSYAAAWTFLKVRTGKINPSLEDVTPELKEEFKAFVYNRYYSVVETAMDTAGIKQMYLGNRIHSDNKSSEGYLRAASRYVDILTVNLYGGPEPQIDSMEYMYQYSGKPLIITEFYAKAVDTVDMNGVPLMNQSNAGWIVESQEDRAAHYENYVMLLLESRCCVGWTWYRFRDNDQCIYADEQGNLYVDYDIVSGEVTKYIKIGKATFHGDGSIASMNLDKNVLAVAATIDLSVAGDPYAKYVYAKESLGTLTKVYKGESGGDNSNNGSNKGLYDNEMNIYQPLADAYMKVDQHIMGLVKYFDALHSK